MIYTGNYSNCNGDMCVSISGDKGKDAGYTGRCCLKLAPVRAFWKKWKANIGKIPEIDNTKYYIHEYYTQVLKPLHPKEIAKKLDNSILLCYEKDNEFCHRHLVAFWLEETLGIKVNEVKVVNGNIQIIDRPEYFRKYLLEEMNNN